MLAILTDRKQKWLRVLVAQVICLTTISPLTAQNQTAPSREPMFRGLSSITDLRQIYTDAKVDQYLKDFDAGKGAFPECGWIVIHIELNSKFSKLNIPLGSVLERLGKERYLAHTGGFTYDNEKPAAENTLVYVTPANERKEVVVEPGKHGMINIGFRNLPNWYLRHGARNPKWDPFVLAALQQQGRDPKVAESFWASAMEKGYVPDKLSSWSGMMISLSNLEWERAGEFAKKIAPFELSTKPSDLPLWTEDIQRLAFLTGNSSWFEKAGATIQRYEMFSTVLSYHLYQAKLASKHPAVKSSPCQLADSMERKSFLMNPDRSPAKWCSNEHSLEMARMHDKAATAQFNGKADFPPHSFNLPPGRVIDYIFSPTDASEDLDVKMTFRAEPAKFAQNQMAEYDRHFKFALANRESPKLSYDPPPVLARILVTSLSFGPLDAGNVPAWGAYASSDKVGHFPNPAIIHGLSSQPSPLLVPSTPMYVPDPKKEHTLRLTKVGRQAEALLDGRRLALVEVPEHLNKPAVYLRVMGCKITVTSFSADTLRPQNPQNR